MTIISTNANSTTSPGYGAIPTAATSGQFLTSVASGTSYTTAWANPNTNFNDGSSAVMVIPHGTKTVEITESATLDVKGTVKINGVDLEERLNVIETLLQIPTRDATMEAKHPKLAELYKQYMYELEKYKTWDRIKGENNGTT